MIFLDNDSTTKVHSFILDKISKMNDEYYYNPSALYGAGVESSKLLNRYKEQMKTALKADMFDNIIFTGSASEANNLAIKGVIRKNNSKILVSLGEHPSVYNVAHDLVS